MVMVWTLSLTRLGGAFFETAMEVAAPYGHVVEYGVMGGMEMNLHARYLLGKGLTVTGYTMDKIFDNAATFEEAKAFVTAGVTSGDFKTLVASRYALVDYQKAFAELADSKKVGRIVLEME